MHPHWSMCCAVCFAAALNMKKRDNAVIIKPQRTAAVGIRTTKPSAPPAAAAAAQPPRGMISPFAKPSQSFISAAITAAITATPETHTDPTSSSSHGHPSKDQATYSESARTTVEYGAPSQMAQTRGSGGGGQAQPASTAVLSHKLASGPSIDAGLLSPRALSDAEVMDDECTSPEQVCTCIPSLPGADRVTVQYCLSDAGHQLSSVCCRWQLCEEVTLPDIATCFWWSSQLVITVCCRCISY